MSNLNPEELVIPKGKATALAQFNKLSRALVGILSWVDPNTLNNEYFEYHEVEMDFENDVIVGNADDFTVIDRNTLPETVHEETLDLAAQERITKGYTVVRQVNVLARAIMRLSEQAGIDQSELVEMIDYIDEVKRENAVRKEYFKNSPDFVYISNADAEQERLAQLEGGLHEVYGARTINGGRVF